MLSPISLASQSLYKQGRLDSFEQRQQDNLLAELKSRDREVRAHELAHVAVGGVHAGTANFSYTRGPDGQRYAIGGEVAIDLSKGTTPEQTIVKAEQIQAAALAPAEPSAADRQIAARAATMAAEARAEIAANRPESALIARLNELGITDARRPGEQIDLRA